MNINEITKEQWDGFTDNLQSHYKNEGYLFTEDLIRYWFVDYIRTIDLISPKGYTEIEVPYSKLNLKKNCPFRLKEGKNRCRADLHYCGEDQVVEFKFHRSTMYSKSCTASDLGTLLNDFNRLSILDNKNKYSIYICDAFMEDYFINHHKTHFPFLDYNNTITTGFKYAEKFYEIENFMDILKHAFSSFLDKKNYNTNPSVFDLRKFKYEIKLIYKNSFVGTDSQKNLYLFVFEILS